ncbi:MAG: RNA polymerase sigma factor [Planctomycetota bacterium]
MSKLNETEFEARWAEASGLVYSVAYGLLGHRHSAEDAMQEAATIAWRKRGTFEPGSNFGAWVAQITRHVALNSRRSRRRRYAESFSEATDVHAAAEATPDAPSPEAAMSGEQLAFDDAVVAALGRLEPTARACLLLKTVHGHSYAEIGGMLGVPEGTAMSHVHRARKRMRETLTERKANEGAMT